MNHNEDNSLFEAALDPRLVYSSGYVTDPQSGIRMWQYYLECAAAAAFASAGAIYQILFARNYPLPMPLQRV